MLMDAPASVPPTTLEALKVPPNDPFDPDKLPVIVRLEPSHLMLLLRIVTPADALPPKTIAALRHLGFIEERSKRSICCRSLGRN